MPSHHRIVALLSGLALWLWGSVAGGQTSSDYVPGELLIRFKPGIRGVERVAFENEVQARSIHHLDSGRATRYEIRYATTRMRAGGEFWSVRFALLR